MSDTADAARRERAEKWFDTNEVPTQDDDDWASNHTAHEIGWAQLIGYLAGAREEAAIRDTEIARRDELMRRDLAELRNKDAEIAALLSGHCKDCCCAKSWDALGGQFLSGCSIPEHIGHLRAEIAALREAARGFLELLDSKPGFFDESYLRWLGEADEAEKNLRRALKEKP